MNPSADPLLMLWFDLAVGGVNLQVVGGDKLRVDAPKGILTDALRGRVVALKPALIAVGLRRYRREDFADLLEQNRQSMNETIANS